MEMKYVKKKLNLNISKNPPRIECAKKRPEKFKLKPKMFIFIQILDEIAEKRYVYLCPIVLSEVIIISFSFLFMS